MSEDVKKKPGRIPTLSMMKKMKSGTLEAEDLESFRKTTDGPLTQERLLREIPNICLSTSTNTGRILTPIGCATRKKLWNISGSWAIKPIPL